MVEFKLNVDKKEDTISSKKLRRNGMIPVNVLDGGKSLIGAVDLKSLEDILKHNIRKSTQIQLSMQEQGEFPVFIKEIQRLPHTNEVIHIDFYKPQVDKKFIIEIGIEVIGSPKGVKKGGQFSHLIHQLKVKTLLADAREKLTIDVSDLDVGDSVKVSDLDLNENWQVVLSKESIVVSVNKTKALLAKERQEKANS